MKISNEEFINKGKNIIEYSKQAYNLYKNQDIEEKRKLLDILFENITLENRLVKYTYRKPFCYFAQCDFSNIDELVDYIKNNIK